VRDALFARGQMGLSLAFHIVFAAIGVAMPALMVVAEWRARRTGDPEYLRLARTWAKGTAIFFAVGAVSGTVLSFELGLLFPGFMRRAGAIIGMPFSLEGFAFFTEAIFLGIYLYGWDRVRPGLHLAAGIVVAVSGLASAIFVTLVNAWMNAPVLDSVGALVEDPLRAVATPFALHEIAHMAVAAYMATALGAAGIHAWALLRAPAGRFVGLHRKALGLALAMAIPCSLAQPLIGHYAGHEVARLQPLKLAAAEWHVRTGSWAPVSLGPIEIPGALSLLAFDDPRAVVRGLEEFPRADWPPQVVHAAWDVMILAGTGLAALAAWGAWRFLRRRRRPFLDSRRFLLATVLAAPLGFVCIEAGWMVTELGRQPWIIYGVLRTEATITPMPGLWAPFITFTSIYLLLAAVVTALMRRHVAETLA
jgi:cytochrome bd ubiquinol oxidase subunit I